MRAALAQRFRALFLREAAQTSAALPALRLEADRIAQTMWQGPHGLRRAGTGENFWQFRRYVPGDPIERIDWRQSARTNAVFVRERERESAQSLWFWADESGSMRYASRLDLPTKAARARVLMLALANLALRGGERVAWIASQNGKPVFAHGASGMERIASHLEDLDQEASNNHYGTPAFAGVTSGLMDKQCRNPVLPAQAGNPFSSACPLHFAAALPRHAFVALCGDFLGMEKELESFTRHAATLNLRGALVHILDPAEASFALDGRVELEGLEGESPLLLPNASSLRDDYRKKMEAHAALLRHAAQRCGLTYVSHITTAPPQSALMQILASCGK
ncbi:MAG: DUF58 domain-containing protein [Bdellovibrionales bacterium]